jgi:hypothetical protein
MCGIDIILSSQHVMKEESRGEGRGEQLWEKGEKRGRIHSKVKKNGEQIMKLIGGRSSKNW